MRTIIALAMILTAGVANGQQDRPPPGTVPVLNPGGFGNKTCAQYSEDTRQGNSGMYLVWAQGYMSGHNSAYQDMH
jgi:hypothetical protein